MICQPCREFGVGDAGRPSRKRDIRFTTSINDVLGKYGLAAHFVLNQDASDRVLDIVPSESNGIAFCVGCFAQMLDAEGVYNAIRHFGAKRRIHFVHFRNVRGTVDRFEETYWDEGKVDMCQVVRLLEEVEYEGCLVPDHAPRGIRDTQWAHRSRAFAIGYLTGLVQAVSKLGA